MTTNDPVLKAINTYFKRTLHAQGIEALTADDPEYADFVAEWAATLQAGDEDQLTAAVAYAGQQKAARMTQQSTSSSDLYRMEQRKINAAADRSGGEIGLAEYLNAGAQPIDISKITDTRELYDIADQQSAEGDQP